MRRWENEKIHRQADQFFSDFLECVSRAQHSIELETYIWNPGRVGDRVLHALESAARRGVRVRILVDGFGSSRWLQEMIKRDFPTSLQIRIFHPIHFHSPGPFFERLTWGLSSLNNRLHRKTFVIDGQVAYIGSANIMDEVSLEFSGSKAWHETIIKVEGEDTEWLWEAFEHAWSRSHRLGRRRRFFSFHLARRVPPWSLLRLNFSRRLRGRIYRDLINRLRMAKSRIWIANPYFVPSRLVTRQLKLAQARGVDVRVLLPQENDVTFMHWVATSQYAALLAAKIRIFEYIPSFLHSKILLVDDWAIVGSTNLNSRSFAHDLEVDVELTHESSRQELVERFELDFTDSRELSLKDWQVPWWQPWLGRLIEKLFRNWI